MKSIGLLPEQILKLKIPMIRANSKAKENKEDFKKYLKSFALDPKNMGELDALEIYYPGGIAAFLDKILVENMGSLEKPGSIWTQKYYNARPRS